MIGQQGWQMSLYNIVYCTDKELLNERYDFITATEVIDSAVA
ncbi:MAG: hypothetical protein ACJA0N_000847 [Pseudohongiellaceae bacterium]|jgi:hypothetical protein